MIWRPAHEADLPLAGIWALAATGAVTLAPLASRFAPLLPACPLHALTGFPCPTCGATRAALHLAHGELMAALAVNPLAGGGLSFAVVGGLLAPGWVALRGPVPAGRPRDRWRWVIVAALLANWVYLAVRGV